MASRNFFFRSPSGGAGYGDLNNNGQQRKYTYGKENRPNRSWLGYGDAYIPFVGVHQHPA